MKERQIQNGYETVLVMIVPAGPVEDSNNKPYYAWKGNFKCLIDYSLIYIGD